MVLQFCKSNLIIDNKEERSIRSRLNDRFSQSSNSLPQVSCPSCIVSPIICVHKVGGGGGGGMGWGGYMMAAMPEHLALQVDHVDTVPMHSISYMAFFQRTVWLLILC